MTLSNDIDADIEPVESVIVIGTGSIGLPLALHLANAGVQVVGVDINQKIVDAINDQSLNLDEAELERLLESEKVKENLEARTEPTNGDAYVVSVPTPLKRPSKSPDLTQVQAAIQSIIPYLQPNDLINIESTIPPMTCEDIIVPMLKEAGFVPGEDVQLAHSPERILPGDVFKEIVENDRIIGGIDETSSKRAARMYTPFLEGDVYRTDLLTAELCKLMENTFRDVNVALANEFALIGDQLGMDITEAIELANNHPRVDILRPGIGVGGHCLPVDPWFLNEVDPEHTNLIITARRINDKMPEVTARKVRHRLSAYADPEIVALGAAYKPNTYDRRNSPAQEIVDELRLDGYEVQHYDRFVDGMEYTKLKKMLLEEEPDVVLQLVPHDETVQELNDLKSWLNEQSIELLQFGTGNAITP